jgi:hypothetical protein
MGQARPMQPWTTLKGDVTMDDIIQPAKLWVDGGNFMEAAIDTQILLNAANTGTPELHLETAVAPEGPWTTLATFGTGYTHSVNYFTTREGGTKKFEKLIRWKLKLSDGTLGDWEITFRICAVLK